MRILIVDDSKAMRSIIMRSLRQAGLGQHSFEEASNGAEALAAVKADPPQLVLSDWNMPEMNGIELLENLRASGSRVRLGFITSETSNETRELAIRSGASFVLTKPFTPETLGQAITTAVGDLL